MGQKLPPITGINRFYASTDFLALCHVEKEKLAVRDVIDLLSPLEILGLMALENAHRDVRTELR